MIKPTKITPGTRRARKPASPPDEASEDSLLISRRPLLFSPELAKLIKLPQAIFLQQLQFWLERATHEQGGRKWIYNTVEEWQADFPFWNLRTIRRIVRTLVKLKLVDVVQFNKDRRDNTNWYTINYKEERKLRSRQKEIAEERAKRRTNIAAKRRGFRTG